MTIKPATFGQIHELHETANRIRRLVCDAHFNAQRIALGRTQAAAVEVNQHRLLELLEELAQLDNQIGEVPSSDDESEGAQ